jgi:hypothetical protein
METKVNPPVIIVKADDLPLLVTLITPKGEEKKYVLVPSSNGEKMCLNKKEY